MRQSQTVHLDDEDQIECVHQVHANEPDGYPVIRIKPPGITAEEVVIFPTLDRLRRLRDVIGAYLAAHDEPASPVEARASRRALDEPDGSADRRNIVAAEAVVDADDLLESIATSYDVRRDAWEDDPDEEEDRRLGIGRRNCPKETEW